MPCQRDALTAENIADLQIYNDDFTAVTGRHLEGGAPFPNVHEDTTWAELEGSTLSHM